MGITARGLGAVPTVVKSVRAPGTEQATAYTAGVLGAACTLVCAGQWTFRTAGFALYFLVFCAVMSWLVLRSRPNAASWATRTPAVWAWIRWNPASRAQRCSGLSQQQRAAGAGRDQRVRGAHGQLADLAAQRGPLRHPLEQRHLGEQRVGLGAASATRSASCNASSTASGRSRSAPSSASAPSIRRSSPNEAGRGVRGAGRVVLAPGRTSTVPSTSSAATRSPSSCSATVRVPPITDSGSGAGGAQPGLLPGRQQGEHERARPGWTPRS